MKLKTEKKSSFNKQMNGVRFYGTKESCLENLGEYDERKHYYVSCDKDSKNKGAKEFTMIQNDIKLLKSLILGSKKPDRNFYIMIPKGEMLQKLKFDLDIERQNCNTMTETKWEIYQQTILLQTKDTIGCCLRELYKYDKQVRYTIDSSCTREKLSFHIIVQDLFVTNNLEAQEFARHVKEHPVFPCPWVDLAVFSTFQNWRLRYCCKKGKTNYKRKVEGSLEDSLPFPSLKELENQEELTILPSILKPKEKVVTKVEKVVSTDELSTLVNLIKEKIEEGTHSLCDEECFGQMCYDNWKKLIFAIAKVSKGEALELAESCIHLYRHYESLPESAITRMMNYNNYGWTASSLHYWARENERYKEEFPFNIVDVLDYEPTLIKNYVECDEKYVPDLCRKTKHQIIHSYLGTGKSTAICRFLNYDYFQRELKRKKEKENQLKRKKEKEKQLKRKEEKENQLKRKKEKEKQLKRKEEKERNESVLIVTPRITFAQGIHAELEKNCKRYFVSYRKGGKDLSEHQCLIIQAESLYKIEKREKYDYVIVDECESFLSQMTSEKTHKNKILTNQKLFEKFVLNAKQTFWLDAFITRRTIQFLDDLNQEYKLLKMTVKPVQRQAIEIGRYIKKSDEKRSLFIQTLVDKLKQGEKHLVYSTSCNFLTTTLIPTVKENCPKVKIIEHHSRKGFPDSKDIRTLWSKYDLVAITSSITVGLNFDVPEYFNGCFIYANASSKNRVRDIFQAHMRVRHLIDNVVYYAIDTRIYGTMPNILEWKIQQNLKVKKLSLQTMYKKDCIDERKNWFNVTVLNKLEHGLSVAYLKPLFEKYLQLCNYSLDENEITPLINFIEKREIPYKFEDIPECTPSDIRRLRMLKQNKQADELDLAMIEKFFFQCCILDLPETEQSRLWTYYSKFGQLKFNNLCYEKGLLNNSITLKDIIEEDSNRNLYNNGLTLRLEVIQTLNKILNIQHSQKEGVIKFNDEIKQAIGKLQTQILSAFDLSGIKHRKPKKEDWVKILLNNFDQDIITLSQLKVPELQQLTEELAGSPEKAKELVRKCMDYTQFTEKDCINLISNVYKEWGYSKLKRGKRKQKRVNGKRVDVSDWQLETDDIFPYIKPKVKSKTETLPSLLTKPKEDKKL